MDILGLSAVELGKKIKAKEISVTDATKAVLAQTASVEPHINSYVTIDEKGALGIITGPMTAASAGITVALVSGLITSFVTKPRSK